MSDEFDPINVPRSHWLQTDGVVLSNQMIRFDLAGVYESITDEEIYDSLTKNFWPHSYPSPGLDDAARLGDMINHFTLGTINMKHPLFGQLLPKTFGETYGRVFREAVASSVTFPINMLTAFELQRDEADIEPYTELTLASIASTFRQRWFIKNCLDAAFTANGVWRDQTTDFRSLPDNFHEAVSLNGYLPNPDTFNLEQYPVNGRFSFSERTLALMRQKLRQRNRDYRQSLASPVPKPDNSITGSTTGCPARHLRPHYSDTEQDQQRIRSLADKLGQPVEALIAPQAQTAIEAGLELYAGLLDRGHTLQQML